MILIYSNTLTIHLGNRANYDYSQGFLLPTSDAMICVYLPCNTLYTLISYSEIRIIRNSFNMLDCMMICCSSLKALLILDIYICCLSGNQNDYYDNLIPFIIVRRPVSDVP
jgi:hypothetical protein